MVLRRQLKHLWSIDQAFLMVRQLASCPPNVFDPYALIGALEHLEDVGCRAGHADVRKFTAVLCKASSLPARDWVIW